MSHSRTKMMFFLDGIGITHACHKDKAGVAGERQPTTASGLSSDGLPAKTIAGRE